MLVNNEDIEIATASNDLKQHKQVFDSISVGAHAALRKSNAEISSFRYFIEKTSDSIIKDSLQNNLP